MEQHVGDALVDGEAAAGLGADEGALLDMDLQERVVEDAEEVGVVEHGRVGLVGEEVVAEGAGGVDQGRPVELREEVGEEARVHLHLLLRRRRCLEPEREAIGHALDVARQHVVRQQPHLEVEGVDSGRGRRRLGFCRHQLGGGQQGRL